MRLSTPNIFLYETLSQYLQDLGSSASSGSARELSHTQWAKKLNYRSPRTIGQVIAGKRNASRELVARLAERFALTEKETRYLEVLVQVSRVNIAPSEREKLLSKLAELRPRPISRRVLEEQQFNYISHWYNLVIKQLISDPSVNTDPSSIAARIGYGVDSGVVRKALSTMSRLGIIRSHDGGNKYEVVSGAITTTPDVSVPAVRQYHHEQALRSIEAIYRQSVDEREFGAATLRFDPRKMKEAKAFIREMVNEFDRRFCSQNATEVFQFNVQFFRQTNGKKRGSHE